jgi:pimeloyl-ACP methyl ester carboxylesterase
VVTLPGYGVPARAGDDLMPGALAERLLTALQGTHEPAVLVGHSASCQVVVHAARALPGRVGGLVLIGPTTDRRAASWPRLAARWLATARHEDPRQVPSLVRQYHRTGLGSMRQAMGAARRDRIDVILARTGCALLVLRGPHDRICPADWADELVRTRSSENDSAVVTLPGGGHMVPLTRGPLVAAELQAFLSRAVGSSAPATRPAPPDGGGDRAGR